MAIIKEIIAENVIIVTENINPAIFNSIWFVKNEIFEIDDILPDSVFVPGFSSLSSNAIQITIVPNQIQLSLKNINLNNYLILEKIMQGLCKHIAQFTKAIGINFIWKVMSSNEDIHSMSLRLFGNQQKSFYQYFSQEDSRLGAYFSQNVDISTRLKLDVKPVIMSDDNDNTKQEFLMYSFNFHHDVINENIEDDILKQVAKWNTLCTKSNDILCLLD